MVVFPKKTAKMKPLMNAIFWGKVSFVTVLVSFNLFFAQVMRPLGAATMSLQWFSPWMNPSKTHFWKGWMSRVRLDVLTPHRGGCQKPPEKTEVTVATRSNGPRMKRQVRFKILHIFSCGLGFISCCLRWYWWMTLVHQSWGFPRG